MRPRSESKGCLGWILVALGANLITLQLVPRGLDVTIENATDRTLDVRVEGGSDFALMRAVEPGQWGEAEICPKHDTSLKVAFFYRDRDWTLELGPYAWNGAVGHSHGRVVAKFEGNDPPRLDRQSGEARVGLGSLLPQSRYARGVELGLAMGLLLAGWLCLRGARGRRIPPTESRPEAAVRVRTDDNGLRVTYPGDEVQSIAWSDVSRVAIETNASGPWGADVWWKFEGRESGCAYPQGATGQDIVMDELEARFPGFNWTLVTVAMGSTDDARFVCWERTPE